MGIANAGLRTGPAARLAQLVLVVRLGHGEAVRHLVSDDCRGLREAFGAPYGRAGSLSGAGASLGGAKNTLQTAVYTIG